MAKTVRATNSRKIDCVKIRMYCLGTGDCFVYKFYTGKIEQYTMMIDCGSCKGDKNDFEPYIDNLSKYVNGQIDLLVISHEHNDHVNGFAKWPEAFEAIKIKKAWFAWTENPKDPEGRAEDLQKKRSKMKMALTKAITEIKKNEVSFNQSLAGDYYKKSITESRTAFLSGLDTLAEINLAAAGKPGAPLPGMVKIKEILKKQKTTIEYLNPGTTLTVDELSGLKFYVLAPPYETKQIYKKEKEGTDVYKKKLSLYESSLAANVFVNLDNKQLNEKDLPFSNEYIANDPKPTFISSITTSNETDKTSSLSVIGAYNLPKDTWRKIDDEWLNSAGSLALRLNSHINNTSLVLAIESEATKNVLLLPADAEFGSWESWHMIEKWNEKGKNGKHLVEDLLNRTIFYKVGHHLSYNGTALEKGIMMMENPDIVAMATLDRRRISKKWKSTMPNKYLMQELIRICHGKLFIMDEFEIRNAPSTQLDPATLPKTIYEAGKMPDGKKIMYKQYNLKF